MATLQEMRQQAVFEQWDEFFSEEMAEDGRATYQDAVEQLINLGLERTREQCMEILGQYVEAFNALDEKYGFQIETTAREEICDTVVELAEACGITDIDCDDVPGEGRDW